MSGGARKDKHIVRTQDNDASGVAVALRRKQNVPDTLDAALN
jgi:hypothetical protein